MNLKFVFLVLTLAAASTVIASGAGDAPAADRYCVVTRIVDGDTFHCAAGGEDLNVRLIGVDTPELRMPGGKEAKQHTEGLMPAGSLVRLELDVQLLDGYRRVLAYVWLADGKMLNEEILRDEVAMLMTIPPNVKYSERFLAAARAARGGESHGSRRAQD